MSALLCRFPALFALLSTCFSFQNARMVATSSEWSLRHEPLVRLGDGNPPLPLAVALRIPL
jgi:hypothetical protein